MKSHLSNHLINMIQIAQTIKNAGNEIKKLISDEAWIQLDAAKKAIQQNENWSGSPCPKDTDNYWIDHLNGDRINALTGERRLKNDLTSNSYAVIYDDATDGLETREEYYERFTSPENAAHIFRETMSINDKTIKNARLVLIQGPIDNYHHNKGKVFITINSDDNVIFNEFDITSWFQNASNEDILKLANDGWNFGSVIEKITENYKDDQTKDLFQYLENHPLKETNDAIGYSANVITIDALNWLRDNKNEIYKIITTEIMQNLSTD